MKKRKGKWLLVIIIALLPIMIFHVAMNKKQLSDIKGGKVKSEDIYFPVSSIHPESAYLWVIPYFIVEVGLISFYMVYKDR